MREFIRNCPDCMADLRKFNDDMIRRSDLPKDAMELIHDIAYHVKSRDVWGYVYRAQQVLKAKGRKIRSGKAGA